MEHQPKQGVTRMLQELRRRKVVRAALVYAAIAWAATEVLGTVLPALYAPEWIFTLVVLAFLVGFPVTMFLAWAFDISADGIRKSGSYGLRSWTGVLIAVGLLLGGTAGLFVLIYPRSDLAPATETTLPVGQAAENSVAVLPFADMTRGGDHQWLADGISETLIHNLAQYEQLRVTARTSAFTFKGKSLDIRQIGRELGVAAVLEGSVQRDGQTLRITAQLIETGAGTHLWSQVYDRMATDLFDVQDEICARVAMAMLRTLTAEKSAAIAGNRSTRNLNAYDLYLLGRHEFHTRTSESLDRASEFFKEAISIEPDYALALSGLADTYLFMTYYAGLGIHEAAELAEPLIRKARLKHPDEAEPLASEGLLMHRLGRHQEAESALRQATELNANYANAWIWLGLNFVQQGRPKEALEVYRRALVLDPLHGALNRNMGAILMLMGRPEQAMPHFEKVISLEPELTGTYGMIAHWQHVFGNLDQAVTWARKDLAAGKDPSYALQVLVAVYAELGLWDLAAEMLDRLEKETSRKWIAAESRARYLLERGDSAGFAEFAGKAFREISGSYGMESSGAWQSLTARNYALARLLAGDAGECRAVLEAYAGGGQGLARARYDDVTWLTHLAICYRALGNEEQASALLEQCLELVESARQRGWNTPTLNLRRAGILALQGDKDSAMEFLSLAVELGMRSAQSLRYDPALLALQEEPGFISLLLRIDEDLDRQREIVLAKH